MPMKSCIFILFAFLLLPAYGFGQRWIRHISPQGLTADDHILATYQDNYRNIWLATGTGIRKASINRESAGFQRLWQSFSKSKGHNLVDDHVNAIAADMDGCLWFATDGGLSRINPLTELRKPENWFNYTVANTDSGLSNNEILSIAVDSDSNKWFGTRGSGVSIALVKTCQHQQGNDPYRNPANWLHLPATQSVPHRDVYAIAVDGAGAIWVGTQWGTVRFEGVDSTGIRGRKVFNDVRNVRSIFIDSNGYVWLGTFGKGVWQVHQDSLDSFHHYNTAEGGAPFDHIGAIATDVDGFLWLGKSKTSDSKSTVVTIIDPKTDLSDPSNWVNFSVQDGVSGGNISSISKDRDGNMWIGTKGSGLTQFDDTWMTFTANNAGQGLSDNTITALTIDRDRTLWLGMDNGDLCKLRLGDNPLVTQNWTCFENQNRAANPNTIRVLFQDSQGYLWAGMQNGVCRLDPNANLKSTSAWVCADGNNCKIDKMVRAITEDHRGFIWLGTHDGLWRTHLDSVANDTIRWCESFDTSDGLAARFVTSLLVAQDGDIWIGTSGGVNRINPDSDLRDMKNWITYTTEDGLIDNQVEAILQDSDGNIWFGTDGGVSRIDPLTDLDIRANWKNFTSSDGLPYEVVNSILQSNKNQIWFGTEGGLGKLDLSSVKEWTVYTTGDGLGSNSILSLAADTSKGDIWIGTLSGGITRYRPKKRGPETFLTKTFDIVSQNIITFEYTGTDLTTPTHGLLYSYKFDNNNWSEFSSATSAQVLIPKSDRPMSYIFKVKAVDKDGNIDPTPAIDVIYKINSRFGGQVEISDSTANARITLHFPPGVLQEGQSVNITEIENIELNDPKAMIAYDILPQPVSFQLKKPVTLAISFLDIRDFTPNQLSIFRQNQDGEWIGIGGTAKSQNGSLKIATAITEFGRYAVRQAKPMTIPAKVMSIQPRIFSPSGGGRGLGDRASISFTLTNDSDVTIKVYNLAGRLIKTLHDNEMMFRGVNVVEWDGKDRNDGICASGLYIVTIETNENMIAEKVMVANKF